MTDASRLHRRVGLAWLGLMALLAATLGLAHVPLGAWNLWIGLAIAALKATIVLALFMHVARGPVLIRMGCIVGAATLAILFVLSGVDYSTRQDETAAMQQPQQHPPLREAGHGAR
jgi:cytochrome c oxidase subunit 4